MSMLEYAQTVTLNGEDMQYVDGVDYLHPDYIQYATRWQKARDLLEGEDELKKTGKRETYLPRLPGHTNSTDGNADYEAFVQYAELYNATGRTVDAYRGLLNRKLPRIRLPRQAEDLREDFTIKGESIFTFIEQVEVEVIATNRVGIFVDYPYVSGDSRLSKFDAKRMNMTPYATMYTTENIINWEEKRINNRILTTLVVLRETEYIRTASFVPEEITIYRILELDDEGYYRQIIIQPELVDGGRGMPHRTTTYNIVKEVVYPLQNGAKMTYIPFYPVTAQGITWEINKSVIEDLMNVNLSHYRNTAIYEKALVWTASPTAVFSGIPTETESIPIGSSQAVIIQQGGTAKYLEYEGHGLDDLKQALDKKEQQMAILGAKILATEVNGVESGEAAMIHRAGEQGILSDIATTISSAIEKVLRIICDWRKINYTNNIEVEINRDYTPAVIDANTIIALGREVQAGRLSYETYVSALQRGEIIPMNRTAKEELKLINKMYEPTLTSSKQQVSYIDKKYKDTIFGSMEEESVDEPPEEEGEEDAGEERDGQ